MEDEVRARRAQARAPLGGVFEAVERDVDVSALERRHEVRPLHLVETRALQPELARDRRRDVDLEPDEVRGVSRVFEDVGLAALEIAPPYELAALANGRECVGSRRAGRGERSACEQERGGGGG